MRGPKAETPTIPVSYCRAIAREVGVAEHEMGCLLNDCENPPEITLTDDSLLTRSQLITALGKGVRLASDPAVGLKIGLALSPGTHGYLGFLAMASPDLKSALESFGKYAPTRVSFVRYPAYVDGEWLICDINIDIPDNPDAYRCTVEASTIILLQVIQFVLGHPLTGGAVELSFPTPAYAHRYAEYIPVPVRFGTPRSRILIPLALAGTKNTFADHQNYELALNRCQALLRDLPKSSDRFADKVRSLLLTSPLGRVSEEDTAQRLFITKRTMARRLKAEGCSFREIRDDVLGTIAKSYLSESTLAVEAIAEILNYHDSASFRRAFKRWYGQTPADFRRSYRRVQSQPHSAEPRHSDRLEQSER